MADEYDAFVRHSIFVERYKARLVRDIRSTINGVTNGIYRTVTASDLDQLNRRQLKALLNELEASIRLGYEPVTETIENALREFSVYEAEWQADALARVGVGVSLGIPSDADLWAAVNARPFEGKFLADWVAGLPVNTVRRVREATQQAYVDGVGPLELARQLRGTRSRKGVMDISARGAEAMARTAIAHTAAVSQERSFSNRRSIKEVQWVAVLDHRTSSICRSRDGMIMPKNEGPRPPAHVSCRSRIIPVTAGNRKRLEGRETYQQWLSEQPNAMQDDILGPSRGALYREGGYDVDRFVDESGQEYTLDQLRAKDQETFNEVFGE